MCLSGLVILMHKLCFGKIFCLALHTWYNYHSSILPHISNHSKRLAYFLFISTVVPQMACTLLIFILGTYIPTFPISVSWSCCRNNAIKNPSFVYILISNSRQSVPFLIKITFLSLCSFRLFFCFFGQAENMKFNISSIFHI